MSHSIPDQALETHIGVLGKTGAGKTYTARGLVERLLTLRRQVVIIDPTGAWWGLRTGFDVPIFGGAHGDIEINDKAGSAVAALVDEQRLSAIVDLSLLSGAAQRRFMAGFAHRLRAKKPAALYLVIDEADEFLPQVLQPDMTSMFGDLKWMVRRGRLNGFRVMMVTQRPAEIAKAVLTQIETLVAHRLTAPQDRKAIEEWVKGHHDPAQAREVLETLASLGKGEAWVWSPDHGVLTRAHMPAITTFDSGRTPEPGEEPVMPPALADLDLSAIRDALAEVEPAQAGGKGKPLSNDEGRELSALRTERDEWTIERARGQQQLDALVAENAALREVFGRMEMTVQDARRITPALTEIPADGGLAEGRPVEYNPAPTHAARDRYARQPREGRQPSTLQSDGAGRPGLTPSSPAAPSAAALAIADLLDRVNPARLAWHQAASLTKRKASGGNFNAARKWLRESGRIVEDGEFIRSAADAPAGMTRAEAIDLWQSVLQNPAPKMIAELLAGPMTKEELGAALGAAPRGGNFNNGVAQLRRNGLIIDQDGRMKLSWPLPGEAA